MKRKKKPKHRMLKIHIDTYVNMDELFEWLSTHDFAMHKWTKYQADVLFDHVDHILSNKHNRRLTEAWRTDMAARWLSVMPLEVAEMLPGILAARYLVPGESKIPYDDEDAVFLRRVSEALRRMAVDVDSLVEPTPCSHIQLSAHGECMACDRDAPS